MTPAEAAELRAKAIRYDRLVAMAAAAEAMETRPWATGTGTYFVVMRSIREDHDLWFGGATNGRVRAQQITRSLAAASRQFVYGRRNK